MISARAPMTADCRRWTDSTIAAWSRRAEQLLSDPEANTATLMRAEMLGLRVAALRLRLARAAPLAAAPAQTVPENDPEPVLYSIQQDMFG